MLTPITLKNLRKLRLLWEESSEDESLINVQGSVGLILYDVAEALRLDSEQQLNVLGDRLVADLCVYIDQAMVANRQDLATQIIEVEEGQTV